MYIFQFNLAELPAKKAYAILEEMDDARDGALGSFTDSVGDDFYLGLLDLVDATEFRRRLHTLKVGFTEPNEFPAEIRNSPGLEMAMKLFGLG